MNNIKAIIGLGNIGPKYSRNRHNIGFMILDALADKYHAHFSIEKNMEVASISIHDKTILLCKPQTFMNNSGEIIPNLAKKGIKSENIIVVHDELEKPFGSITLKIGGSSKGHNGLKSIIQFCGLKFMRLRFGIGRPESKDMVPAYVLQNFNEPEDQLYQNINKAVDMIETELTK